MFVFGTMLSVLLQTTLAGPEGAQVVHGDVSFSQSGNTTSITASDRSIINYSSFDIARPEVVEFIQPNAHASVLNRINSARPTNIEGTLRANGGVIFVNPAGVYIREGARINANRFVASALNISDADFMSGRMNFAGGDGSVINRGDIVAEEAYLVGREVVNSGNISCPAGYVVMAAGERVFLRERGSNILVEVEPPTQPQTAELQEPQTVVSNEGTITASGGSIAFAAGDIYSHLISNTGSLTVSAQTESGGQVKVSGGGEFDNAGTIEATSEGASGGTVTVNSANVINSGTVDVTGIEGGTVEMQASGRLGQFGTIHADGTAADGGKVDLSAGEAVALAAESLSTANAGAAGDGGDVKVYSPDTALFWPDARIEATGGTESGDGGLIELSGHEQVHARGSVDASAQNGSAGTFMLDPTDITVVAGEDVDETCLEENVDPFRPVWNDDASVFPDAAIENCLSSGTNVILDTTNYHDPGPYDGDGDITVAASIDPSVESDASEVTLTLLAANDIVVEEGAVIDGTGLGSDSKLDVALHANVRTRTDLPMPKNPSDNDDQSSGSVEINAAIITNGGNFESSGIDIDINAAITTDGGDFVSSGADFDNTGGTISTKGSGVDIAHDGKVDIQHTGTVTIGAGIEADGGNVTVTAGGSVQINADILTNGGNFDSSGVNFDNANGIIRTYVQDPFAGSGHVRLDHTGNVTVGLIDAGIGDVTIKAGGEIEAAGSEAAANIVGRVVDLTAETGPIGPLGVVAKRHLNALASEVATDIIISSPDDLRIGMVNAGEGNVTITASGTIAPIVSDAAADIVGGAVDVRAEAGKIDHLDVAVLGQLDATAWENGDIIISSAETLRLGSADTGGRIDIEAKDAMTVAGGDGIEVRANESMTLHSGAGGEGNLSFDPGATLSSRDIVLRAGDGLDPDTLDIYRDDCGNNLSYDDWPGGGGTGARVDFANLGISYEGILEDQARSLTIWQDAPITGAPERTQFTADSTSRVDLLLQSDVGDVSLLTADEWNSVSATALSGIELKGFGDITTGPLRTRTGNITVQSLNGDIIANGPINAFWRVEAPPHVSQYFDDCWVPGGGVELLAYAGRIHTGDEDTLNVPITGYSDGTAGVHFPGLHDEADRTAPPDDRDGTDGVDWPGEHYDTDGAALPPEDGVAAIVIRSHESLILGEGVHLEARGTYEPGYVSDGHQDDRQVADCLCGPPETYETGDPFDAAIYVGSFGRDVDGVGDVTVNASVLIDHYGTMVIDAEDTVHDFGNRFKTSWGKYNDASNGLELIARGTETLNDAFRYETLPGVSYRLEGESPPWLGGSPYVLRGMRPARVLQKAETPGVPSVHPEGPGDDEIVPWPPGTELPAVETPVRVKRSDGTRLEFPEQGTPLGHEDQIYTGKYSRAFLEFPGGWGVLMDPNTHIAIGSPTVTVKRGTIRFFRFVAKRVEKLREKIRNRKDKFRVKTERVTLGVAGTEFYFSNNEKVKVVVVNMVEDCVRLAWQGDADGSGETILDEGYQIVIPEGEKPVKIPLGERRRVMHEYIEALRQNWLEGRAIPSYDIPIDDDQIRLYY